MSKVELAKIPALTFYQDEKTSYRRTTPLPQLVCVGKPCNLYQPEVVRCVNLGGRGVDVDWKCEADLPEALRFGKVTVSCEGWSRPGDPFVLKDSCSLEYRLVQIPGSLLKTDNPTFNLKAYDWSGILFYVLWIGILALIVYSFVKSCLRTRVSNATSRDNSQAGGGTSGRFPGGYHDYRSNPPPPYTKNAGDSSTSSGGWRPGFWTGALVGGLADNLYNRNNNQNRAAQPSYDWERFNSQPRPSFFGTGSGVTSGPARRYSGDDRGEGSSNLGAMRRSTAIGGSKVR